MMMANISRLRQEAIQNGQLINANDLNQELDQLVNKANQLDNAIFLQQTFTGNKTFANDVTINGTTAIASLGLGVSALTPVADLNLITTTGYAVADDATLNKPTPTGLYNVETLAGNNSTSAVQVARLIASTGQTWVRQQVAGTWGAWVQQSTVPYALGDEFRGGVPFYASTTAVTMPALQCLDSTRSTPITCVEGTLNLASAGLNGLDVGSLGANTWYYCHAILNPTTGATGYIASTSSTAPTLPGGFTIRRLLPFVFKTISNSTSLQLFRFHHAHGMVTCDWLSDASRPDTVIFNQSIGSATPFAVDASSAIPPICGGKNTRLIASFWQDTGSSTTWSRLSTDFDTNGQWDVVATSGWVHQRIAEVRLSSNARTFRVRNDASGGGAVACACIIRTIGYVFNYLGVI